MLSRALLIATSTVVLATLPLMNTAVAQIVSGGPGGPFEGIHTRYFANKAKVGNSCTGDGTGCCVSTSAGGDVWVYNCTVVIG